MNIFLFLLKDTIVPMIPSRKPAKIKPFASHPRKVLRLAMIISGVRAAWGRAASRRAEPNCFRLICAINLSRVWGSPQSR